MKATIVLILTIITPPNEHDIVHRFPEPSIEKCWEDARAFIAQGIPKGQDNAEGLAASCAANTEALKADERS